MASGRENSRALRALRRSTSGWQGWKITEESWRRNHKAEIVEKKSWRRDHGAEIRSDQRAEYGESPSQPGTYNLKGLDCRRP